MTRTLSRKNAARRARLWWVENCKCSLDATCEQHLQIAEAIMAGWRSAVRQMDCDALKKLRGR